MIPKTPQIMTLGTPRGARRFLSCCLQITILLMSILHSGISSVKADVHCYCNLSVCVISNYMCRSSLGTCVSDHFGYNGEIRKSRHACLELVLSNPTGSSECPNESTSEDTYPTRTCCKEDLCNYYRHKVDVPNPLLRLNHSYMTDYMSNEDFFYRHGNNNKDVTLQHRLWFKAAVIAVPIAGGFILILLIIMAARILREDHKRQRQLAELRRQRQLNTHVIYSGEKSCLHKSISSAILNAQLHRNFSAISLNNNKLYKNVSIAISTDTSYTDTSRDKYFVFDL